MRYLLMGAALALSFCSFEVSATGEDDSPLLIKCPPKPRKPQPTARPVRKRTTTARKLDFSDATLALYTQEK